MKTLVLGGYGNFGTRICRALASDPDIALLVGGRDGRRAQALADQLAGPAAGLALDHRAPGFTQALRDHGVELLIHAAGPFQQQAYDVAHAAAEVGAHYIDLSDGRRSVCDFPCALDGPFRAAGRTAISGASTVPALSSAVIDHLCAGWQRVDAIDTCIAPAQKAPRGKATLAGVFSYCGEPIQVWTGGRWQALPGWAHPEPVHFARMATRLGALCDIPDLELFPGRYQVQERVMFRAALEVRMTQRAVALLARLRGYGIIPNVSTFAGVLDTVAPALDFLGTSLGGMVVRVAGVDAAGQAARSEWHIAADHDHGPEIPCMAAILLARKLARNEVLPAGAHACAGFLSLAEFEPEFARWGMVTDTMRHVC